MLARKIVGLLLCGFTVCAMAQPAALPEPKADYRGTRVIEAGPQTVEQKVWVSGQKERAEMSMEGMQMIMIARRDKQLAWMIIPQVSMYREIDIKDAMDQMSAAPSEEAELTELGDETIDGFDTTRYRIVMKDGSAQGHIWLTDDGIPVKMDMTSGDGTISMRMRDLVVEPQDASKFELPPGLRKMPAIGGLPGG